MNRSELVEDVKQLMARTGAAHHEAFIQVDGADDDWALWYAGFLQQPLGKRLGRQLARIEIARTLAELNEEVLARDPDADWRHVYAEAFVDRYRSEPEERLSLYQFAACPFCARVRRVIEELNAPVELRDIFENPTYRDELMQARGRTTVPVLRCDAEGRSRWMPESADIIAYLRDRFGE